MRVAFDTSVLVAALVEGHPFHARAWCWLEAAAGGEIDAECSWHAVAETWSVLTRLPLDPPVGPALARLAIDRLLENVEPVELGAAEYRLAIVRCAGRNLRSGALFDALHLASAEARGTDCLATFNPVDFERLRAEGSPPVVVPPDPPAPPAAGP